LILGEGDIGGLEGTTQTEHNPCGKVGTE